MSASRQNALAHTEVSSGELPLIGEARRAHTALTLGESGEGQWLLDALAEAIEKTTSQKAAAIAMRQDRAQTANQLKGNGNLYLERVGRLRTEHRDTLVRFANNILLACGAHEDPREAAAQDAEQIAKALVRLVSRVR